MVLRVPFAAFAEAVRSTLGDVRVYAHEDGGATVLTAGGEVLVICREPRPLSAIEPELKTAGLVVSPGYWSLDGASETVSAPHVTAIAYRTGGEKPGVWVDASLTARAPGESVQALYDEFAAGGEITGMTFDEFVAAAHPTVVEITPERLAEFVRRSGGPLVVR